MIVLGIDPGTAATGVGVIEQKNGVFKKIHHDCIKTNKSQPAHQRLRIIYQQLSKVINQHQPQVLAMESLFFAANAKSAISVGQAMGVIMLASATANIPVFQYTPPQIKRQITGYGRAPKAKLQKKVRKILHLRSIPRPQHAADALAVAICHLNSST